MTTLFEKTWKINICLLFFLLDLCSEKNVTHDDHFFLFPPTHVGEKAKIECMGKFGVKKNASYECVKNGTYYAQWTNFNDSECFFHDNSKSSLEELSKESLIEEAFLLLFSIF